MSGTVQTPPSPEPDAPMPSAPEPYWHRQLWLPSAYRDSIGILADLTRRLLSRALRLRWRIYIDVRLRAEVNAPDEHAARIAVQAALQHHDTIVALSRADVGAVPPWRPLGTATRVEIYTDIFVDSIGPGAWQCVALMLAVFTVDVTDATWPDRYFAVDIIPGIGGPRLRTTEADGLHIERRRPTRCRR